jgi:hypothetical protein
LFSLDDKKKIKKLKNNMNNSSVLCFKIKLPPGKKIKSTKNNCTYQNEKKKKKKKKKKKNKNKILPK